MATRDEDTKALFAPFTPPVLALVYPDEGAGIRSEAEWSRIANELEQKDRQKKKEEQDQSEDQQSSNSSTSSDVKYYRVDHPDEDGGEPIRWLFPISSDLIRQEDPDDGAPPGTLLEKKMADEVSSLYCLHGSFEVEFLVASIDRSYSANLYAWADEYKDESRPVEEQFKERADVYAAYAMVRSVYLRQREALLARAEEHKKVVTKAAATIALSKLQDARTEILAETMRYIELPEKSPVSAQKALETGVGRLRLDFEGGAEFRSLLDVVERIKSKALAVNDPPPATAGPSARLNPLATSPAEDAAHALEYEIAQACERFPVLHRTWPSLRLGPYVLYDQVIFGALRKAWAANDRLSIRLWTEPEIVWLYPTLIHETVEVLAQENPDYGDLEEGARAAQELIEQAETRITAVLAQLVGILDVAAIGFSPAPPVALAIAGASLVFQFADTLAEYKQLSAQDDAFNAALDPRKSVTADPSYFFFALGIAFSLLDLKGLSKAYKAARVTREVDELGNLVKDAI